MPSAFTHAAAALAIDACLIPPGTEKKLWVAGVCCAVLPDLDAVGFWAGVPYGSLWGHRGFTHSLTFALLLALAGASGLRALRSRAPTILTLALLFLTTASHGLLDALTYGGLGVALFAPFDNGRYFFPVRPISVSPISVTRFFTARGLSIFSSELLWVWVPSLWVAGLAIGLWRRGRSRPQGPGAAEP